MGWVLRLAEHWEMPCVMVNNSDDPMRCVMQSTWMLLTDNQQFLHDEAVRQVAQRFRKKEGGEFPLWTDQQNNLLQILQVF